MCDITKLDKTKHCDAPGTERVIAVKCNYEVKYNEELWLCAKHYDGRYIFGKEQHYG